ncbi:MAG: GAF domain-containing protein [Cyanobacteria bacterium J055]|nr:MAG: GAF domain-containing protein [Cyanobacteria bacterium J055]
MSDPLLYQLNDRLSKSLEKDVLIQSTLDRLRTTLQVDRVVLSYFYRQWKGRVTFESLSSIELSIYGSTGADDCFNNEYATLYEAGRIRAIDDIATEPLSPCHREFLESMNVRSNLVAPILTPDGLWGLLVAHHCQAIRPWSAADIAPLEDSAKILADRIYTISVKE